MAGKGKRTEAVAYIRTSSAANVGADRDSDKRQRAAMQAFAKAAGYEITAEFYEKIRYVRRSRSRPPKLNRTEVCVLCTRHAHRNCRAVSSVCSSLPRVR
jgi:hypothetical protein